MEEAIKTSYKLGSEELSKELEGKFYKFALNIPQNIEVIENQEVEKKIIEFEKDGEKKVAIKWDINILVDEQPKVWSVSNKVLTTINEHIKNTTKFKILLREKSYEVIPLGLKE